MYFVYLLRYYKNKESLDKGFPVNGHIIYTGYSSDVVRRLHEHITMKRYSKRPTYTSQFGGCVRLMYIEIYDDKNEALLREREIKKFSRDKKIFLVQNMRKELKNIIKTINNVVLNRIKLKNVMMVKNKKS